MREEFWQAIVNCDEKYDGDFFYGPITTKIYCKPSCKSRTPRRDNVTIFFSSMEAQAAGYRPCKRCQPDMTSRPGLSSNMLLIRATLNFIDHHFHQSINLMKIANAVHTSPYYLHRLFKKYQGITPQEYVHFKRMEQAKSLLTGSEQSITEIASLSGFQSSSHFSNAFHKHTEMTPSEYRKHYSGGNKL